MREAASWVLGDVMTVWVSARCSTKTHLDLPVMIMIVDVLVVGSCPCPCSFLLFSLWGPNAPSITQSTTEETCKR